MSWIADKLALLICAAAMLIAAWVAFHYAGQWYVPAFTVLAFAVLLADNSRLRKRLRALGEEPNARTRRVQ
ncbi:hypothetical protein [Paraburkholderia acidipaludis]|uniref:hypothetical protein n=1 Tax=Paraburkholderia acidipaludis TaxID=660537 RepID=UPI0004874FC9|nr:hypothetical protein [Paraburkholderia acidipaludis]